MDQIEKKKTSSMDKGRLIILVVVVAVCLGVFFLLQTRTTNDRYHRPLVVPGQPAPDFAFHQLNGPVVRLSDYRGKIVFLNIWATWCRPCREEMPSMEKLYQALKGEAFEILAVSIDAKGAQVVGPFMRRYKLSFPALLDPGGTIQDLYQTTGVPESFIIDKNGMVVSMVIGPRDWAVPESIRFLRSLARRPEKSGKALRSKS